MGKRRHKTDRSVGTEARGFRGAATGGWLRAMGGWPVARNVAALLTSRLYVVRGDSMRPAFEPAHHLLVSRMAYAVSAPSRGDVVIVHDPRGTGRRYLKRVVGLPGEEVRLLDGVLFLDGVRLEEPYLEGRPAALGLGERVWKLGTGESFVLGDNRLRSTDSREFGPVRQRLIVGKAWLRYWPPRKWGPIR